MDVFAYSIGYQNGYEDAKREFGITWHPYPEEKPSKCGEYLVTILTQVTGPIVDTDLWCGTHFESQKVIAWMERPKAYKGE